MNNKGFSLLETVIALGLMSIASLTLASFSTNLILAQNANDAKASANSLAVTLLGSMSDNNTCSKGISYVTQNFDANQPTQSIGFSLPNRVIAPNTSLNDYKLNVLSLTYSNYKLVQTNPDNSQVYYGDVKLTTQSQRNVLGSKVYGPRLVASVYFVVLNNVIVNCSTTMPTYVNNNIDPNVLSFCQGHHGWLDIPTHACHDMQN